MTKLTMENATPHQKEFVALYAADVRSYPECYETSVMALPEAAALRLVKGLNDAEVAVLIWDLKEERRRVIEEG